MKLGFYTTYSKEMTAFAQEIGFGSLQLAAWPNSSLDADTITDKQITAIQTDIAKRGLEISALGIYSNYLDPESETREEARRYFIKVLDLAHRMDVSLVCTFAGGNPLRTIHENIQEFADVFSNFCEEAERRNLRIAIENCPMIDKVHAKPTNIAFSPIIWDLMFDAIPSETLGLELDPSHMVWLQIDYVRAIHNYKRRIFHVHAKDMEIKEDALSMSGILGGMLGKGVRGDERWWRARIPGWGMVNWPRLISALVEIDYEGNIDIEHEDSVIARGPQFRGFTHESQIVEAYGSDKRGLFLGYASLSGLIPK